MSTDLERSLLAPRWCRASVTDADGTNRWRYACENWNKTRWLATSGELPAAGKSQDRKHDEVRTSEEAHAFVAELEAGNPRAQRSSSEDG